MIRGKCHTSIDEFRSVKWPENFVAVPRIGEFVEDESGRRLRVYSVAHKERRRKQSVVVVDGTRSFFEPFIYIELTR